MTHSIKTFIALLLVAEGFPANDAAIENLETLNKLIDTSKLLSKTYNPTKETIYQNDQTETNEGFERNLKINETKDSLDFTKPLRKCSRGEACTLSGSVKIISGLNWTSELLNPVSKQYLALEVEIDAHLQKLFLASYLRSGFVESRIEAFSFQDQAIIVDFYVLFNGLRYDIDAKEIEIIVSDSLEIIEDEAFLGKFKIEEHATSFHVMVQNKNMKETLLPKWGWGLVTLGLFAIVLTSFICICVNLKKLIKKKQSKMPSELAETIKSLMKSLKDKQDRETAILSDTIQSLKRMADNEKNRDRSLETISKFAQNYNIYNKNMYSKVDMWSLQRMIEKAPSLTANLSTESILPKSGCPFCRHC